MSYDWREAEIGLRFEKNAAPLDLYPVFKRFTQKTRTAITGLKI
jgi:hypothetical protein